MEPMAIRLLDPENSQIGFLRDGEQPAAFPKGFYANMVNAL